MSLLDTLEAIFPKPQIPQKRYLLVLGLALYYAAKVYVSATPDPSDDYLPDKVRTIVFEMFSDSTAQDTQTYGETS